MYRLVTTSLLGVSFTRQSERWGGEASVRYAAAVEISSSSTGSGLCCDLSLIVFGSKLLAQLTGNKGSSRPFRDPFQVGTFKKKKKNQRGWNADQEDWKRLTRLQTRMNSTAFWVNRTFSFQEAIQALGRCRVNSGDVIFSAVVSCQLNAAWLQNCSKHKWICGSVALGV